MNCDVFLINMFMTKLPCFILIYNITVINQTMHSNCENNHLQEEISIPVKISDCIFMGDEVIAHVLFLKFRTLNG